MSGPVRARDRRGAVTVGGARTVEVAASGVALPRWSARLARFCRHVLREAGAEGWDISILLCDDGMISDLNRKYRGIARPTDVLSFSRSVDPLRVAGDIAISWDTLRRNAKEYGVSADGELKRLTTHGILRLAGMDHGRGKGRAMLALQERIVEKLRAERIIEAQGAGRRLCVPR